MATSDFHAEELRPEDYGNFGLGSARLYVLRDKGLDTRLFEALTLLTAGLDVLEELQEQAEDMPSLYWPGMYLLRQAHALLDASQIGPTAAAAAEAAMAALPAERTP